MAGEATGAIEYGGIILPGIVHTEASVRYAHRSFQVRDSDVFNLTYPKSVLFGSWFDHVKGWLTYRNRTNFLLLTYDDLLQNLQDTIIRICQFLGKDLDASAVDSVVANASFETMKGNKMVNYSLVPEDIMDQKVSPFLRKGISGDWKNHFTPEQSAAFHCLYQQNMKEVDIRFPWDELQSKSYQDP